MKDDLWFYGGCALAAFLVCQIAGVPLTLLPLLILATLVLVVIVMLVFAVVTLPGRIWDARRHRSE